MSKQIDEKVVSMQFDNKHFESNVQTTLGTLDKLKQSLNFTGAIKGMTNIGSAVKSVNMGGLGSAVETVQAKFSALGVMAVTALTNITNSAVNAGKRIVSALTIDPIKSGFNEYELKMGAIQTIMASTGESLETVNQKLNELNKYSDQTIYSFQDMTSNIGKFTNAGVNLDDAVEAMKGISNEAAVSGANANEASRAMYNFAQALSAGYVKLIDWKSIENANMATVEFKNELIKTGLELGTVVKQGENYITTTTDAKGSVSEAFNATMGFNEALSNQWMTSEVLIETLKRYADETTDIGKKASQAATEVKTFSQLFDTLKESAQSGWAQTWEIIVGDFNESKTLMTTLSEVIGGFLDKISDRRNTFLEGVFGSNWEKLYSKIDDAGISVDDFKDKVKTLAKNYNVNIDDMIKDGKSFEEALNEVFNNKKLDDNILNEALKSFTTGSDEATKSTKNMTSSLEEYQDLVRRIINGEFGNGEERYEALTKAGYEYAAAQNMVNEELGYSFRYESKLYDALKSGKGAIEGNTEALAKMSDKQLKANGYTEEQIAALRELAEQAEKTGTPINELIDNITQPSGRDLIFDTVKNVLEEISPIFTSIKEAWDETFTGMDSNGMYSALEAINDWSANLDITEEVVEKVTNIAKGVMAFTKLFTSFSTKLGIVAFDVLKGIFGITTMDILDMAEAMGNAVVELKNMIFSSKLLEIDLEAISEGIVNVVAAISEWIREFLKLPAVKNTLEGIKKLIHDTVQGTIDLITGLADGSITIQNVFDNLKKSVSTFFDNLTDKFPKLSKVIQTVKDAILDVIDFITGGFGDAVEGSSFYTVGKNIIEGIKQGLRDETKTLGQVLIEAATTMIEAICNALGIHSPSTEGVWIGENFILGIIEGIKNLLGNLWDIIANIGTQAIDMLKNLDLGAVLATTFGVGLFLLVKKVLDIADNFTGAVGKFGKAAGSISSFFDNLSEGITANIKATAWEKKSQAIYNMAKAIGVLAASIAILSYIDSAKLWESVAVIAALAGVLLLLSLTTKKLNMAEEFKLSSSVISIAAAVLIMATAMKKLSSIENMDAALQGLIATVVSLGILLMVIGQVFNNKVLSANLTKAGTMLLLVSGAMLILTTVVKRIAKMDAGDIIKGIVVVAAIEALFAALMFVSQYAGANAAKAGAMILMMSVALLAMTGVISLIAKLDGADIAKGFIVVTGLSGIFAALMAVSQFAGRHAAQAGIMLLAMSGAFYIMVQVIDQIAGLDEAAIVKGLGVITLIGVLFTALVAVSKLAGQHAAQAGVMLLSMATSMLILTGVIFLLSEMDPEGVKRALGIVTVLEALMMGLIAVTKKLEANKDLTKTLTVLVVAIGILSAAVIALSFIEPDRLIPAAAALSALIGMFSLLVLATSKMKSMKIGPLIAMLGVVAALTAIVWALSLIESEAALSNVAAISILLVAMSAALFVVSKAGKTAMSSVGALAALGLVVAELAIILGVMSALNIEASMNNAIALSTLLLAMSASLAIMSVIGKTSSSAMSSVGALAVLGLVVAELAIILGTLAYLNIEASMGNVAALSALLIAMTGVLAALSLIGPMASSAFIAIGALAVLGLVMAELAAILAIMSHFEIEPSMETAKALSLLLMSMSGALVLLSVVGALGPAAFVGVAALATLITGIGGLLVGIGALMDKFPALEEFLDKGIPVLEKIGYALGSFFGNIIGGFTDGAMSGIPEIGTKLSEFMDNLQPFIDGIKMVDESAVKGVKTLAEAILILTAADLLERLPLFGKSSSFADFGAELATFGPYLATYAKSVEGIDVASVEASANAAKALSEMAKNLPKSGGWLQNIIGESTSVDTFGQQLVTFGESMSAYGKAVSGIDKYTEDMEASAKAGAALSELADSLPESGGFLQKFLGETTLDEFGGQLKGFGEGIMKYGEAVSGIDEYTDDMEASAKAGEALAEIAEKVPSSGGWLDAIVGSNSIDDFGSRLKTFGEGLKAYGVAVNGIFEYESGIEASIGIIDNVVLIANKIKDDLNFDFGESEIMKLGTGLGAVGDGISKYIDALLAVGYNAEAFNQAKAVIEILVDNANYINDNLDFDWGESEITKLGTGLASFSADVSSFITNFSIVGGNIALLDTAKLAVEKLVGVVNYVNDNLDFDLGDSEIVKMGQYLSSFGTSISSFATNFSGVASNIGIMDIAKTAVEKLVEVVNYVKENLIWDNGEAEIAKMGGNLSTFGSDISKFMTSFSSVAGNVSMLDTAKTAVEKMVEIVNYAKENLIWDSGKAEIVKVGNDLASFGKKVKEFSSSIGDASSLTSKLTAIKNIATFANSISGSDFSGLSSLGDALGNFAKDGVKKFVSAFSDGKGDASSAATQLVEAVSTAISSKLADITTQGKNLGEKLADGIESKKSSAKSSGTTLAKQAVSGASSQKSSMTSAGYDLGDGLVVGIQAKWDDAYNAGYTLGQQAVQGEKDGQASASPSKLTIKAGKWLGEGLVIGMGRMMSKVYNAGYDLGDTASGTISSAIASVANMLDSDIDAQPTIRPVMDLSDVEAGASAINNMFGMKPSIGLLSNVRSINTMMNRRNQNGTTAEVVSAIKDLKKTIGSTSGNTYTIGGITYSEGSEVSNAIEALVRAVTIERRV